MESLHEGIKYNCDQFDYKATQKHKLEIHKESQQEGIKYDCDHQNIT